MEGQARACDEGQPVEGFGHDESAPVESFVRNDEDKARGQRFSLARAFSCAGTGFAYAFRTQRNMKVHAAVAALAVALGFVLGISVAEWAAIVVCIAVVFAVECLNTAVESLVDLVSPGYAELARRTKDCAAAAVLACAAGAVCVAAVVFLPRIVALVAGAWGA